MKGIYMVIGGMVAAGTLAGCSADHSDRYADGYLTEAEREAQEIIEEQVAYYREYFVGNFHGERDYSSSGADISWCEDITFTPFETPTEVTGITDITADGKAEICSYILCDDPEYAMDAVTTDCYYVLQSNYKDYTGQVAPSSGIFELTIYFYQYDIDSGFVSEEGRECLGHTVDDDSCVLTSFYPFTDYTIVLEHSRQ